MGGSDLKDSIELFTEVQVASGGYRTLATDTEVNSCLKFSRCFSIHTHY